MKGDKKVIDHLNKILGNELVAINQFITHAQMWNDWGFKGLGNYEYQESTEERDHSNRLIERILFLEGSPNMQYLGELSIGKNTKEMLECDLKIEFQAIQDLKEAIEYCESVKDYVSRDLLKEILVSEEEHVDHIETELNIIDQIGIQNYLQLKINVSN